MTEESKAASYPEFDENGKPNPLRLPVTGVSEQWEIEQAKENDGYDPCDIETLANEPNI